MPPELIEPGILPATNFLFENLQTTMLRHEDEICFNEFDFFMQIPHFFYFFLINPVILHSS